MAVTEARSSTADRAGLADMIIAQFRSFFREVQCMGGDRMRRSGVSMTHFHVVSMLERHGEMPMSRMADLLDVSLSNATGIVDRLEERGLVERVRVPDDRRVVLVRTTDLGRSTLAEMEVLKDEMLRRMFARLDTAQLARIAQALEDVKSAAHDLLTSEPEWKRHQESWTHDHAAHVVAASPVQPSQTTSH